MGALDEIKGETLKTVALLGMIFGGILLIRVFFISVWLLLLVVGVIGIAVWFVSAWLRR